MHKKTTRNRPNLLMIIIITMAGSAYGGRAVGPATRRRCRSRIFPRRRRRTSSFPGKLAAAAREVILLLLLRSYNGRDTMTAKMESVGLDEGVRERQSVFVGLTSLFVHFQTEVKRDPPPPPPRSSLPHFLSRPYLPIVRSFPFIMNCNESFSFDDGLSR